MNLLLFFGKTAAAVVVVVVVAVVVVDVAVVGLASSPIVTSTDSRGDRRLFADAGGARREDSCDWPMRSHLTSLMTSRPARNRGHEGKARVDEEEEEEGGWVGGWVGWFQRRKVRRFFGQVGALDLDPARASR